MVRTIVVANQKGGVGKTTTVANLGAALAERGRRVVLVDLDPQAALTAGWGIDSYHVSPNTSHLLLQPEFTLDDMLHPLGDRLWLAPASGDLAAAEYRLNRMPEPARRLRQALAGDLGSFDYVLLDTPPSLGLLTVNGLSAADELLVPVECAYLALRGLRGLLETVWLIRDRMHPDLRLLGILATMHQPDSAYSLEVTRELRRAFGEHMFRTMIERDEAAGMAPAARTSVLAFRPHSRAAAGYRSLALEVEEAAGTTRVSPQE